jgi:hypothetical protein
MLIIVPTSSEDAVFLAKLGALRRCLQRYQSELALA